MPCFVYSAQYACTHAENYTVRCNHPPWYIFVKTMAVSESLLIPWQIRISKLPENKLQNGSYLPSGIQWVRELLVFISLIAIDIHALQKSDNLCIFPLHIYVHTLTLQCLSSGPKFLLRSKKLGCNCKSFHCLIFQNPICSKYSSLSDHCRAFISSRWSPQYQQWTRWQILYRNSACSVSACNQYCVCVCFKQLSGFVVHVPNCIKFSLQMHTFSSALARSCKFRLRLWRPIFIIGLCTCDKHAHHLYLLYYLPFHYYIIIIMVSYLILSPHLF